MVRSRRASDSEISLKPSFERRKYRKYVFTKVTKPRPHDRMTIAGLHALGQASRKRGRPSKADLLLREQMASMQQASGIEAEFAPPQKKKRGRKKKSEIASVSFLMSRFHG